jgi:hypothetical protein
MLLRKGFRCHRATAIVAVVSDRPKPPEAYKARLDGLVGLSHVTVEVHPCLGDAPVHQAA